MIDFHSHILPMIDDGSKSVEESLEMLLFLKAQGVDTVVATPHYKGEYTVEEFLKKRHDSYKMLEQALLEGGDKYPKIILGAEVAVECCIEQMSDVNKLCIEGTNYLLVEMPMKYWVSHIFDSLYTLSTKQRVNVIIAHIERYYMPFSHKRKKINNNDNIFGLVDMQYILQFTTSSINHRAGKKFLKRLVDNEAMVVFGSDCHNMTDRQPDFLKPMQYVAKKYGKEFVNRLNLN